MPDGDRPTREATYSKTYFKAQRNQARHDPSSTNKRKILLTPIHATPVPGAVPSARRYSWPPGTQEDVRWHIDSLSPRDGSAAGVAQLAERSLLAVRTVPLRSASIGRVAAPRAT